MLCWMHHRNLHSAGTLIHCTCVTSSSFAGNDELVAVEDSTDVGNVLWMFYDCLYKFFCDNFFENEKLKNPRRDLIDTGLVIMYTRKNQNLIIFRY